MFKRGGRLTTKPAAGAGGGGGGGGGGRRANKGEQLDSISSKLERKVANCLSCGKIFDCRNVTNDIIRFIGGSAAPGSSSSSPAMRGVAVRVAPRMRTRHHVSAPGAAWHKSPAKKQSVTALLHGRLCVVHWPQTLASSAPTAGQQWP
jgi:hypothetical protein